MLKLDSLICRYQKIPWQIMDGHILALTTHDGHAHEFNETAAFVWQKIEKEVCCGELLETLCEEYEVEKELAHQDLFIILQAMEEKKLIQCRNL